MTSSTTQKQNCNLICKASDMGNLLSQIDTLASFVLVIALIGTAIYRQTISKTDKVIKSIRTTLTKDKQLANILTELREATDADRVVLGLIHNTSIYAINYHLLKISVLHESLKPGIPTLKKIVRDIPLALLTEELHSYNEHNELFATLGSNNCKLKEGCQLHLASINAHTICNFKLIYRQVPIGILSFQFNATTSINSMADLHKKLKQNGINLDLAKLKIINDLT